MCQEVTLAQLRRWLLLYADRIDEEAEQLTVLDAAIGDADHGANMVRGMSKVRMRLRDEAEAGEDVPALFRTVAMTLISSVGGAAGPLYGAFFLRAAQEPQVASCITVTTAQLAAMFRAGAEGVQNRGKAAPGEKTMLDVLFPAVDALEQAAVDGLALQDALHAAVVAAQTGLEATIAMEARKGRASYLGPRSIGHQDPGGTSSYYLFETLAAAIDSPA
jgi:dihydroxyacetone kinase-like protein